MSGAGARRGTGRGRDPATLESPRPIAHAPLSAFASCAPGLEAIVAAELDALGLSAHDTEPGGLEFETDLAGLYRANLHLRVASRVLVRVAAFKAAHFGDLERAAAAVNWGAWIGPRATAQFRVTSRKSRLYHQKAIRDRFEVALTHAIPGVTTVRGSDESDGSDSVQQVMVRLSYDHCTVSVDSSGALLHRRGYRQSVAKAPLRETLAAAMLLGAGWDPDTPLLDPMCGSGTIAIEAALLARRIPPGWWRSFAFQSWPGFDPACWEAERANAAARITPAAPAPILASDRDAGAVTATRANAERAGVLGDLTIREGALSTLEAPGPRGLLLTNPPYGLRIGEADRLRDLFAQLGHLHRRRIPGWSLGILSASPALERQLAIPMTVRWTSTNGGIPIRLLIAPGVSVP